jgi:hypothetical protein
MKTKCPNCGYQSDIDGLIRLMSGGEAFITAFDVPCELKQPLLKYLGLFRNPTGHDLTWDKLTKIIGDLTPAIRAKKVTFNKQVFDAPKEAFIWGIEQVMKQFGEGKLTLPLKNHHYLFAVMQSFDIRKDVNPNQAATLGEFVAFNGVKKPVFAGRTQQETWDIVNQAREPGESLDETYERIKSNY